MSTIQEEAEHQETALAINLLKMHKTHQFLSLMCVNANSAPENIYHIKLLVIKFTQMCYNLHSLIIQESFINHSNTVLHYVAELDSMAVHEAQIFD